MQNLLTDLLTTLSLPEWPIASLMLLSLSAQLLSSYGINSSEIKVRELALDFIGQVARIKEDTLACEKKMIPSGWNCFSMTAKAWMKCMCQA